MSKMNSIESSKETLKLYRLKGIHRAMKEGKEERKVKINVNKRFRIGKKNRVAPMRSMEDGKPNMGIPKVERLNVFQGNSGNEDLKLKNENVIEEERDDMFLTPRERKEESIALPFSKLIPKEEEMRNTADESERPEHTAAAFLNVGGRLKLVREKEGKRAKLVAQIRGSLRTLFSPRRAADAIRKQFQRKNTREDEAYNVMESLPLDGIVWDIEEIEEKIPGEKLHLKSVNDMVEEEVRKFDEISQREMLLERKIESTEADISHMSPCPFVGSEEDRERVGNTQSHTRSESVNSSITIWNNIPSFPDTSTRIEGTVKRKDDRMVNSIEMMPIECNSAMEEIECTNSGESKCGDYSRENKDENDSSITRRTKEWEACSSEKNDKSIVSTDGILLDENYDTVHLGEQAHDKRRMMYGENFKPNLEGISEEMNERRKSSEGKSRIPIIVQFHPSRKKSENKEIHDLLEEDRTLSKRAKVKLTKGKGSKEAKSIFQRSKILQKLRPPRGAVGTRKEEFEAKNRQDDEVHKIIDSLKVDRRTSMERDSRIPIMVQSRLSRKKSENEEIHDSLEEDGTLSKKAKVKLPKGKGSKGAKLFRQKKEILQRLFSPRRDADTTKEELQGRNDKDRASYNLMEEKIPEEEFYFQYVKHMVEEEVMSFDEISPRETLLGRTV